MPSRNNPLILDDLSLTEILRTIDKIDQETLVEIDTKKERNSVCDRVRDTE